MSCKVSIQDVNVNDILRKNHPEMERILIEAVNDNFENEQTGSGKKWAEWRPYTIYMRNRRRGHYSKEPRETRKVLQWTQDLKNNTKVKFDMNEAQNELMITLYNNTPYAYDVSHLQINERPFIEPSQKYLSDLIGVLNGN